jgi:Tfp pilus assembly protein PilX
MGSLWLDFRRGKMVRGRKVEEGFAFIAALLAIWILTALGMLVFTVTTQDVRVSSRMLGERKAFSAVESGISWLMQNFNPANPGNSVVSNVVASSTGDPNTQYGIGPAYSDGTWIPKTGPTAVPVSGYAMGGGETWGRQRFLAQVSGTNTAYNTSSSQLNVQVNVGIGYGPVDISTSYR